MYWLCSSAWSLGLGVSAVVRMRPHSAMASACSTAERLCSPYWSLTWKMLAVGRLDLRGEAERDLDDLAEALLLDRDRVQVVLAGLGGVADAQAGGLDGGAQLGDLAAVLATGREVRRGLAGEAAAQGAQLGVVLGLDLQRGGRERVGLLLVVAGLLPGVGGDLANCVTSSAASACTASKLLRLWAMSSGPSASGT
jgi:hypothetical protein